MSYRMTQACLEGKVSTVNRLLGFDVETITYSTPGAVVLYGAYGGTGVHRYSNTSGGMADLMGGCRTKREAGLFLDGMIQALWIMQESI